MILNKKYFLIFIKIIAFICWVVLTAKSLFLPMVTPEADAYSRLGIGVFHSYNECWLPLYPKFLQLSLIIFNGMYFIGPRLISWISILVSGFLIEKIIFKSTKSLFLASLGIILFLFHPLVIDLSTITLSEPLWCLFVLASIFFTFYSEKKYSLYIGLLLWSISQGIRYESWLLTPLFLFCLIICQKITKKNLLIVLLSLIATPILWITFSYFYFHNGLEFIKAKQLCADHTPIPEWGNLKGIILAWYKVLTKYIFHLLTLVLYLFSLFTLKKSKDMFVWLIPLYLILTLIVQVYVRNMENFAVRFLFLIIPTIIIVLMIAISRLDQIFNHYFFLKILFVLVAIYSIIILYFHQTYPYYTKDFDQSKEVIALSEKIDLKNNWKQNVILIHAQNPNAGHFLSYLNNYQTRVYPFSCTDHLISNEMNREIKEGDYLLNQTDLNDNSCTLLLKDEILISKTKNFELYLKK